MNIKETIDKRIQSLEEKRGHYLKIGDKDFATQLWARLEELKELKRPFVDKNGNWKS